MRQSVTNLENFYGSRLGLSACAMVHRRLKPLWPSLEGQDVLGYGYAIPYLEPYETHRTLYAMPADQGAVQHNSRRGNTTSLVYGDELPFMPVSFDRVLVAHGLEEAPNIAAVLQELWRVMKPEARIVIVCANRAGLWARSDQTPFGAGRPFSRSQINRALKQAGFVPVVRSGALYSPPLKFANGERRTQGFEIFGETVWPSLSGLVMIEAVKRLYAGQSGHRARRTITPRFVRPLGASSGASGRISGKNAQKQGGGRKIKR